jgi:hypothetical protein
MSAPDNQKLLDIFTGVVENRRIDLPQALSTPLPELAAGRDQGTALLAGVVRPNTDEIDARAAGRQRFPALQGTAGLFAEGLAKNADIAAEILAAADDFTAAVAVDQAVGRFVFAGELLAMGGSAGELLAATAAQRLCQGALAEARARITDPAVPAVTRSDVSVAFAEPFRLEEDNRLRQQAAQAAGVAAARPYLGAIDKAQAETELAEAVDTYLGSLQPDGGAR